MNPHNQNQISRHFLSRLELEFILIDYGRCPDWSRPEHTRRRDCIYLILDGQGKITIDGTEYFPQKNDMVLLPKGSKVSLYSENDTCYTKYWCDFSASLDSKSLFKVFNFPKLVHLESIDRAKELFNKLENLHIKTDIGSALMMNSIMFELLSMFFQNNESTAISKKANDSFINSVTEFINKNIDRKMSISEIAAYSKYNEKYFIELFRKSFGTTPAKYIKSIRLENSKKLLLYTNNSIVSIICQIGYSTVQKFSRDFKEYTGFAPSEFRKRFR